MFPQVEVSTFTNTYRRTFVDVQAAERFAKQVVQAAKQRTSATVEVRGREVMAFDNRRMAA